MAGLQNSDLGGTYVDPNSTAWGGDAGKAPIDYAKQWGTDQYGDPAAVWTRQSWQDAQDQARQTTGQAADVARYRSMADAAAYRPAPTVNNGDAYGRLDAGQGYLQYGTSYLNQGHGYLDEAKQGRDLGLMARGDQSDALGLQRDAAYGNAPSQAQLLGRNLIDQSLQAQLAGAASARGGGMAQAAAMRQAAQGAAGFQQQGVNSLSAMRAQEMATARDAYQAGATGIRGQDYIGSHLANESAGQATGMANSATGMANSSTDMARVSAQMQQYQADVEMRQRALDQAGQMGFEQMGFGVNQAALNANMGLAGNAQANDQFRTQMALADQQRTDAMYAAAMSGGSTVAAGALARRAGGGPVSPGQPVLVGEQGPELIVPQQSGMVLPATHPASMQAAKQNMSMADVMRLRQQADQIEHGLRQRMAAGPSTPHTINLAPVVIDDAPEPAMGGMSMRPAGQPDMSTTARLMGGREGYDAPQLQPLYGGREDPYEYGGAREEGGPVESDKAYLVGESGPEVIVSQPKYTYDASQPFGDRFVPNPAYVPAPPPEEKQKPVYVYDASKPFGDRFVPAAPRQMTFERNDDAEKARLAKEHEQAALENARNASTITLLQGPGVAAPAAGSSLAHYIQSILARSGR